jgi:hypothetical protein
MRHFFLPRAITSGSLGMFAAATQAQLVALPGGALRIAPGHLGTIPRAVDIAAVAAGTDEHLDAAARAEEEARGCISLLGFLTQTWTQRATSGILPRHTCLHDVGRGADTNFQVGIGAAPVREKDRDLPHLLWLMV